MKYVVAAALAFVLAGAAPPQKSVDVAIETTSGTIVVRLDVARAPRTARHFLRNVDAGKYDGASFYRNVTRRNEPQAPFEVIQGGLGAAAHDPAVQPIALEGTAATGLHNSDGALAMARTSDPDSATTEFFIDFGDARYLDAGGPLGPGYAVFGRVVRGMDAARKIHGAPTQVEELAPSVRIVRMHRVAMTAPRAGSAKPSQ